MAGIIGRLFALTSTIIITITLIGCGRSGDSGPGAFALLAPADAATDVAVRPTFEWELSDGAAGYTLVLADNLGFTDPILEVTDDEWAQSFAVDNDLDRNTTYHWRVTAHNANGDTQCAADFSFTTLPDAPGGFALLLPEDSATGVPFRPTLMWGSSENAETYTLWIKDGDGDFVDDDRVVVDATWTTSYAFDADLDEDTVYRWQVAARNAGGETSAEAFSFRTELLPPTISLQPVDSEVVEKRTVTFQVEATGAGELAYQWQQHLGDWQALAGENEATLSLQATLGNDGARFRCAVTNAGGTVYSAEAILTVTAWDGAWKVDAEADSGGDGLSWDLAFADLQEALDAASSGEEIWVAAGAYYPTRKVGGDTDRHKTFQMKNGVAIYGGFSGTEAAREERDWRTNLTILSGELDAGSAYHVFFHDYDTEIDASAVLDGFVITSGNANGEWPFDRGGGMRNEAASPTIANCVFTGNRALFYGGAVHNVGGAPSFAGCSFIDNSAGGEGGALYNDSSDAVFIGCEFLANSVDSTSWACGGAVSNLSNDSLMINCLFAGNEASGAIGGMGGAVCGQNASQTFVNCTLYGNSSIAGGDIDPSYGGAIYNYGSTVIVNCIVWGNLANHGSSIYDHGIDDVSVEHSCVEGGWDGVTNIADDPLFVDAGNGDLRLQAESLAIDAGTDAPFEAGGAADGVTTDLDGNPRIEGSCVDMGAYEHQ